MNEYHFKEDIFKILRMLSADDNVTQRDLSRNLGISLGKTNYLLKSLTQKGFLKARAFKNKKRKLYRVGYILTPKGFDQKVHLTYLFLKRKEKEYLELKKEFEENSKEMELETQGGD